MINIKYIQPESATKSVTLNPWAENLFISPDTSSVARGRSTSLALDTSASYLPSSTFHVGPPLCHKKPNKLISHVNPKDKSNA
jgi:O-succinylbenzoate synthase